MIINKIAKYILIGIISLLSVQLNYATQHDTNSEFAYGADVSWLTQMEASGRKFYDKDGNQMECMALLKSLGVNSIRLRVWVNPTNGWCNSQDLLAKAIRASQLGLRLMINFHYSDSWADPAKQTKPVAWSNLSYAELRTAVTNHTTDVLNLLKDNNITPEWVQVGNETGNGMLWDDGKASSNMMNYAQLNNAGYDAVKAVFPDAKVVVHVQNGYNTSLFQWLFNGLKNNGGKFDVIGMSLYPNWYTKPFDWRNCNIDCLANMNNCVQLYGKEVMIVETGMSWDSAQIAKPFLTDLIAKVKSVNNGKGMGVFYWEPQSYGNWQGYTLGAFDNTGKPTMALDAFKSATSTTTNKVMPLKYYFSKNDLKIVFENSMSSIKIYTVDGKCIVYKEQTQEIDVKNWSNGVYIIQVVYASNTHYVFKFLLDK